jgi:hypothetical protein
VKFYYFDTPTAKANGILNPTKIKVSGTLLMHKKSRWSYYISLFLICLLIGFCLGIGSTAYLIVFDTFGGPVHSVHVLLGFLAHFSLSTLSIVLWALFIRGIVKKGKYVVGRSFCFNWIHFHSYVKQLGCTYKRPYLTDAATSTFFGY